MSLKLDSNGQKQLEYQVSQINNGDTIPYLGRERRVVAQRDHYAADSVKLEPDRLIVNLKASSALNTVLEGWYRGQADKLIRRRADALCARLGVTYRRLTIRGARTRWASCSHKGNLNFNWRLMMVPPPVIDYVIIHELAHRQEMNHSRDFWGLVAEHCSRWRRHRRWLRDNEADLAAILPV